MFKSLIVTKSKEKSYLKLKRNEFPKFDSDKYVPLRLKDFSKLESGVKLKLAFFDFAENKWKNFTFEYERVEKPKVVYANERKNIVGKSRSPIFKYVMRDHNNNLFLHVYDNSDLVYYSLNPIFSPIFRKVV